MAHGRGRHRDDSARAETFDVDEVTTMTDSSHDAGGHELVRRARPPRDSHAGQGDHGVRRRDHDLRGDGRSGPPRWPAAWPSGRRSVATSWLSSRTTAPSSWRRSSPPTTSARSRCRSTGGSPHRRCGTSSSTPEPARSSATSSSIDLAERSDEGHRDARSCERASRRRLRTGGRPLADLRAVRGGRVPESPSAADDIHRFMYTSGTTGRPKGVMITHANLAWKNLAHIIEFGFTERRSRPCLRTAVPRRCARPHDNLADRRRCDHHHPPFVRGVRRGRRARAIAGDHRVAGPRHGQRDHGAARHRAARPVVGARGHQRRREDADPAHRTDPAHLSLGLVRRRLRPHRDGLG